MSKDRKLLILTLVASIILVAYVVTHYERKLYAFKRQMRGVQSDVLIEPKSAGAVRTMIKKLPTYQGDSIVIDEEGKLVSQDGLIQSVINQMYEVPANLEGIQAEALRAGLPEPYVVYKVAIGYYIAEHGDKRAQEDTLSTGADSTIVQ